MSTSPVTVPVQLSVTPGPIPSTAWACAPPGEATLAIASIEIDRSNRDLFNTAK
jgi:hypothetical protein